jgi:cephalosporin-C deacetylase
MALFDLPIDELRAYKPALEEPGDFDAFWQATLREVGTHDLAPVFTAHDAMLPLVDVHDVRFTGFGAQRIAGWFIAPRGRTEPGPAVVQYLGYNSGRGLPHEWLLWPAAGYPVLVVDTRGQGDGETADPDGGAAAQWPGFLTRGVLSPHTYYYRRVFSDAVRAVDVAAAHPLVDATRIVVSGGSQGGGIAQAVAGLRSDVFAAIIDVPFLTDFRRATEITDRSPYREIVEFLAKNRERSQAVFDTLAYFDGLHFAARARADALYSVALMDEICPPSTVFGAINHYAGPVDVTEWKFNGHEGGGAYQARRQLAWLRGLLEQA